MAVIRTTDSPVIEREYRTYDRDGSGIGTLLSVIIALAVLFLLLFYGLPLLRGAVNTSTPQVNVPGTIDVNVNRQ